MNAPSEPRLLLMETSGRIGQVGLADGASVRVQRQLDQARRHARDLAPALRAMLREQGWRPADITAVVVSRGPGSYTGLRVGIMSAKAFAFAVGCPILGIETFAAIALQAGPGSAVEVIANAQQERVFVQRFQVDGTSGLPRAASPIRVQELTTWLAGLPSDVRVTGPGLEAFSARIPEELQVASSFWQPSLHSLHHLAMDRLQRGEHDDDWDFEPIYARPSSAEEQWVKLGRP